MRKLHRVFIAAVFTVIGVHASATNIVHVGNPRLNEPAQSAVSMNSDLMGAARALAPSGWTGFAQRDLDTRRQSSVSIKQGEPWVTALERWLAQEGLTARLDWQSNRFYLNTGSITPSQSASPAQQAQRVVAPAAAYRQPAATPAISGNSDWSVLVSDVRLERTLERWAKQAGYTLIWDADRHILITAEDTFTGNFVDALNRVLNSPAIRESDYPLEAVFYANNPPVLRITGLGEQTATNKE